MITMVLCFTGGAFISAVIILIIGADIRFRLRLEYSSVRLNIEVRPPKGPALIRVDYLFLWQEMAAYRNGKRLKPRKRKKLRHGRLGVSDGLRAARRGVRIKELRAFGGIGVREDARLAVLLTGAVREALGLGAAALEAESCGIGLWPAFDRDELCLILEGILRLYPAQIICAALNIPRKPRPNYPVEGHRA